MRDKYLRRVRWKGEGEGTKQEDEQSLHAESPFAVDPNFTGQVCFLQDYSYQLMNLTCMHTKEVAILGSGDFFGELALLRDDQRAATVTANEQTKCVCISRKVFTELQGAMQSFMEEQRNSCI